MSRLGTLTRRGFLIGSATVAGGVAFGYWKYRQPLGNPLAHWSAHESELGSAVVLDAHEAAITPYILLGREQLRIITPRAEMGQGVHTTLAALVAEELDVALDQVRVEHGPASRAYYNAVLFEEGVPFPSTDTGTLAVLARHLVDIPARFLGLQVTGGSSSVSDGFVKMRKAGAAARAVLVQAAALRWGVEPAVLSTERGVVLGPHGKRVAYGELVDLAAGIEPPTDPPLKPAGQWVLLGRTQPRVDMAAKCSGKPVFSIDMRLPDMVYATVVMNPHLGGAMNGYDASRAEAMRGVIKVVPLEQGVAVVASNTWYALKAAKAIRCNWLSAAYPDDTAGHFEQVARAFDAEPDSRRRDDGDVERALAGAGVLQGEYRVPYLAHATMEPLNAVAWRHEGRLDIWAGNQFPTEAVQAGAALTGLEPEAVQVHTTFMGGGFGRRGEMDFIRQAVQVAQAMQGVPVKLTWSREEDMTHDTYRPLAMARFRAAVRDGRALALDLALAAPSVLDSQLGRIGQSIPGPDTTLAQGAWDQPCDIPNYRVSAYRAPPLLPVGSWRAVGASQNGFFHDCAIDEMAQAARVDPLQFRLGLISHAPSRAVLERVATMASWGTASPEGRARGVAFVLSLGVPTAVIVEVSVHDRRARIPRAWVAVDVGTALDPGNIEAQVQSGLIFGLTAAMMGEITVQEGVVRQTNFHDYPMLQMHQTPSIEVAVLENGARIRGIGEPGTPPAAPALANALFAATGQRIRELPLGRHFDFV